MRATSKYSYYCIERWCEHNAEHNGFPSRSPILKFGEASAHLPMSTIPTGVEPHCREVDLATAVFGEMKQKGGATAGRVGVLKAVIGTRKASETLQEACERCGVTVRRYSRALEEFTYMLNRILTSV